MTDYTFEYDTINRVLAVRFASRVTDESLLKFYEDAPAYIAACTATTSIIDFSAVTTFDVSTKTIRYLAERRPLLPDPTPRVIVAPTDEAFGMSRMFQTLSRAGREMLQVVRTRDQADRALNLRDLHF